MKWLSILGLAALGSTVLAAPMDNEKRQSGCTAITGVSGNVYPRLEVRQMMNTKPNQWTLFLLAFRQYMDTTQSNSLSYYSIAGIHGVPRQNWDNVGQCSSCGNTDGYCPHDSVLFPAWHRAYLALFEQQFMTIVNQIANSYPASQKPAMTGAASTMRFPYWDWAAQPPSGTTTFPSIVQQGSVTVNGPTGKKTFTNPLFRFDWQDTSQMYYSPFTTWQKTYRYPNSNSASATSNNGAASSAFTNIRPTLQDQVYQLFTTCADYLHFSNDNSNAGTTACSNSLEGIHNTIHTNAGGPGSSTVSAGHMTYLATSAFDPLFWLHHMNVDRYFAMWQAINPNSYGASQVAPHSTWTIAQGSTQDANSPLSPFHKDTSCNFWTTNTVKSTTQFGYTYPEFSDSDGSAAAIQSFVKKLYGPSATATAGSSKRTAAAEALNGFEKRQAYPQSAYKAANGSTYEYVANIVTPRYALGDSYTIYVFVGQPASQDPASWSGDANMAGLYGVLAQEGMAMNVTISGSVPLTRTLTSKLGDGELSNLQPNTVNPYLTSNLVWKIVCKGQIVDPTSLPGFEVSVYSTTATDPSSAYELPKYGAFSPLYNVTNHKAGGLRHPGGPPASLRPTSSKKATVTSTVSSKTTVCTSNSCSAAATATTA